MIEPHLGLEERQVGGHDDESDGPEVKVAAQSDERILERCRAEVLVAISEAESVSSRSRRKRRERRTRIRPS
jgi:hypothetical protein